MSKKFEKILIFGILAILVFLSGCVEQKKDITLTMADEIHTYVNFSPIVFYAKFNESVNGTVRFYIDTQFIGDAYSNGTDVFMEYYGNLTAGEYKVKAVFPGNAQFNNASAFSILKVLKYSTGLDISFEPYERVYFKDLLNVTIYFTTGNEWGCVNKEISLYVNDKFFGKNLTNDECFAKFILKNLSVGRLNARGEYKGNEIYEDANATNTIVVVSKIPVKIFADSKEVEARDRNVTISADIKDYLGRNVPNYTLKVIHNERVLANLTAERNTFVLNISNWTLGVHRLQVIFDGTEIYENKTKDVFVQIINKFNISGVEVKSEIPLEEIIDKKIAVWTDGSNISEYCAYEFESIADQKGGYKIYIKKGDKDSIFLGKNGGIITVKHEIFYEMLPCHVFLCINKNISCSIPEIIEALGKLENLSIALDEDVSGRKVFEVYNEILSALGYIQAYLITQKGKKIYMKKYIIRNGKCEFVPTINMYQNLTAKEVNECDFKGIFIRNADKRFMGVKDGKILLEGDETALFFGGTILKWIIAPGYAYDLRTKTQR